jgi:hypothetical protein
MNTLHGNLTRVWKFPDDSGGFSISISPTDFQPACLTGDIQGGALETGYPQSPGYFVLDFLGWADHF